MPNVSGSWSKSKSKTAWISTTVFLLQRSRKLHVDAIGFVRIFLIA